MKRHSIHRVWERPESRSFCLRGLGVCHLPGTWMCSLTWKFSEPHTFGIFMETSSHRYDQSLTPFLAPLLSGEREVGLKIPSF